MSELPPSGSPSLRNAQTCPKCGEHNSDWLSYCQKCGEPLNAKGANLAKNVTTFLFVLLGFASCCLSVCTLPNLMVNEPLRAGLGPSQWADVFVLFGALLAFAISLWWLIYAP